MLRLNRRHFATSALASLVLAPFLRLEEPRARAASGKSAKRLLLFCTMGTHPDLWKPTSVRAENDFTFSEMTQPLAEAKQHIVLVDGLVSANPGDNHAAPDGLTGLGFNFQGRRDLISVDQFIGDQLQAAGDRSPVSTLLLGARAAEGGKTMFHRTNNLPTISSPLSAYTTVFGAGVDKATPAQMVDMLKRRKSVLDLIRGEVTSLEARVGKSEKAKLEAHLDALRQVEIRLSAGATAPQGACQKPTTPSDDTSNVMQANLLHLDVISSAFACGLTRIAAIEFGNDNSLPVNLPEIGLQGDEHGGFIHGGNGDFSKLVKLERWFAARFVAIINQLKSLPEADGSGSLFDNTLIAWCRDMGDAVNHNQKDMKFVLAGGAGGYLKTDPNGRYLHGHGDSPAARHERILLNLIEAMGFTRFAGFGDATLSAADKTPLPGVSA